VAITGKHPDIDQANEVQYLAWYNGGAQYITRSLDGFVTRLSYGSSTSAVITTASDDARCAICKLRTQGRPLVAVVPHGGDLETWISYDDGATWSQVS